MSKIVHSTLEKIASSEKKAIISGPFGSNISSKYFVESGIPVIRGNNLSLGLEKFCDEGFAFITKEKADELSCDAFKNDLIFTAAGTIGQVGIIPSEAKFKRYVISNKQIRARLNTEMIDIDYAYYWFSSPWIRKILMNSNKGSTVPLLTLSEVKQLPISYPVDKTAQKKISGLLNAIYKKIELNNKIISELESMAKTLYDYWFLQFDFPDENGKPYKSSGGKMVWNEELKREIPEDFLVDNLSSIILNSKNGDWGNESYQSSDDIKIRCFRGADFPSIVSDYHVTAPIRFISKQHEDRILTDGDLVIEISGGSPVQSTGRIGYINKKFLDRNNSLMTCSNFCKAITLVNKEYQYWYYQTWKKYYDSGVFFNYEGKTTGIKNLMFDEFTQSVKVAIPSNTLLCKYHKIVSTLYDKIQHLLIEDQELASLRDFLLPMLMNGQVTFKD